MRILLDPHLLVVFGVFFFRNCFWHSSRCLSKESPSRFFWVRPKLSSAILSRISCGMLSGIPLEILGFIFFYSRLVQRIPSSILQRVLSGTSSVDPSGIPLVLSPGISQEFTFGMLERSTWRAHEGSTGGIPEWSSMIPVFPDENPEESSKLSP